LEHKQDKAKTKFQEMKTSGDEAWEAVKGGGEKPGLKSRRPITMRYRNSNKAGGR